MAEQEAKREMKTVDIIDYSMQDKPIKVSDTFNHIVTNKVVDSLANKKQEISAKMFSDKEEPEAVTEPEVETTEEKWKYHQKRLWEIT